MSDTITVTARIPARDNERLQALAQTTGRTKGSLVSRAIQDFLENQAWQIEEIQKAIQEAIQEADTGNFASKEDTEDFFAKWQA